MYKENMNNDIYTTIYVIIFDNFIFLFLYRSKIIERIKKRYECEKNLSKNYYKMQISILKKKHIKCDPKQITPTNTKKKK